MLKLIPVPLHRSGLKFAHLVRRIWWRMARPQVNGVTVIARDGEGRVLLVRHSYGLTHWTLPGGGINRGEEAHVAAQREFAEELDCALYNVALAGVHDFRLHGAPCSMHVFSAEVVDIPRADGRELIEARFFALHELPDGRSAIVDARLAMIGYAPD